MSFRLTVGLFLYGVLLLCLLPSAQVTLSDPDTLWHIAAGDEIRRLGALPAQDPWSFTAGRQAWLNISWLFDILLSRLHEWFGLAGIAKLAILLMTLHGILMFAAAWRYTRHLTVALGVTLFSSWCLFPSMLARPQWITYMLALVFVLLLRFGSPRSYALLPLLMLLWANLHGGFFLGFFVLGIFGLEALWQRDFRRFRHYLLAGVFCLAAIFLTPLGPSIFHAVLRTMQSPLAPYLTEWQPLRLETAPMVAVYLLLFLWVSALRKSSIPLAERLLAVITIFLALTSARMLQVAVTLSVPYLALGLQQRLSGTQLASRLLRKNTEYAQDLGTPKATIAAMLFALSATAFFWSSLPQRLLPPHSFRPPASIAPVEETAYLAKHHPGLRLLNHYDFGGYLIYAARGTPPVFIDGRADTAYPRLVIHDYLSFFALHPSPSAPRTSLEELMRKHRLDGVMTPVGGRFNRLLAENPHWEKVHEGESASILLYRGEKP